MTAEENTTRRETNWTLVIVAAAAGVSLSVCLAIGGFFIGRATTSNGIADQSSQTIREVEVTREVVVTVVSEVVELATVLVESPDDATPRPPSPTPLPTATLASGPVEDIAVDGIDFSVFNDVWDLIESEFDGFVPDTSDVFYAAVSGSLEILGDEHTHFLPPDLAERRREEINGTVSGIGAYVFENEEGVLEVSEPIKGSPAESAGLLAGDRIVGVDDVSVAGLSFDDVLMMVRGEEGTSVRLLISRGEPESLLELTIVRANVVIPIVESELLRSDNTVLAYLRLRQFNANAAEQVTNALDELLAAKPDGLILDLRNNPGGLVTQTVLVADLFLPQGVLFFERNRYGLDNTIRVDDGDVAEQIPMVVLVNGGSASASEIVSAAIRDSGRGILIGEVTVGKGSEQRVYELSDGSQLLVTSAHWYTPLNANLDEGGLVPDIVVEAADGVALGSAEDTQLQRAIDNLVSGS